MAEQQELSEHFQTTLFPLEKVQREDMSLHEHFLAFHKANPHVFFALHSIAIEQVREGWKRGSINMLFERLRWLWAVRTRGDEEYVLNNNHRAFYARYLMRYDGRLDGFFRIREQSNDVRIVMVDLGLMQLCRGCDGAGCNQCSYTGRVSDIHEDVGRDDKPEEASKLGEANDV